MLAVFVGLGIADFPDSRKGVDLFSNGNADGLALCQLKKWVDSLPFIDNRVQDVIVRIVQIVGFECMPEATVGFNVITFIATA